LTFIPKNRITSKVIELYMLWTAEKKRMKPVKPNILIVGAGAVGMTYGLQLHRAGAKVSYFVKPYQREKREAGTWMVQHRLFRRPLGERFSDYEVLTELDEVRAQRFDQVWLSVSSTAIRGDWLPEFLETIGEEATLVSLQPGLVDRAMLEAHIDTERIVSGLIGLIAYECPLDGETLDDGFAYLLPPGSPSHFGMNCPPEGVKPRMDMTRTQEVVRLLRRGGGSARTNVWTLRTGAQGSAMLMPAIATLEIAGWRFDALRENRPLLELALGATSEATSIAGVVLGWSQLSPPPMGTGSLRWLLRIAPHVMPFDLETYLEAHFSKVGDQTEAMLARYVDLAQEHSRPCPRTGELLTCLRATRSARTEDLAAE
jgi:2-dehydropantoate 2-reductase